jgi:hypothetical protein
MEAATQRTIRMLRDYERRLRQVAGDVGEYSVSAVQKEIKRLLGPEKEKRDPDDVVVYR